MNTTTRTARSAAFAYAATLTLAMLATVGSLFGAAPQAAAEQALARAADAPATEVVVIEGKRIARS